jgi:hypothetical protein
MRQRFLTGTWIRRSRCPFAIALGVHVQTLYCTYDDRSFWPHSVFDSFFTM